MKIHLARLAAIGLCLSLLPLSMVFGHAAPYEQLELGKGYHRENPSNGYAHNTILENQASVAADQNHTCVVTKTGGLKCWGSNSFGQLGDGTTTDSYTPVDVFGLTSGVLDVSVGLLHTCALTSTGGVKCWGDNHFGQLGDGTNIDRLTPVDVAGLNSGVRSVSTGDAHTCAITEAGGLKCWGENHFMQLGDGSTTDSPTPVDVQGLTSGVRSVSAGEEYSCAVTEIGGVKCWGWNRDGQLGDGTIIDKITPVDVVGLTKNVRTVESGDSHTCAVTDAGGVMCWGKNFYGQLGDGTTTDQRTPMSVLGLASGIRAVSVDYNHTCALTEVGGVECWGWNRSGQLGDSTNTSRHTPVHVIGMTSGVLAVSAGDEHTCAITADGGLKCWGDNTYGQLGDGTTTDRFTPVDVLNGSGTTILSGRVTDPEGVGLAGVKIEALDRAGLTIAEVQTDSTGAYTFPALPTGMVRLLPNQTGYQFNPRALTVNLPAAPVGQNFLAIAVACGPGSALPSAPNGGPACINPFPKPFLDLPVAYSDFSQASKGNEGSQPGKINSWFDHTNPNDANRGDGQMQNYLGKRFSGQSSETCTPRGACYDGHNALDFQHDYSKPNEGVRAAGEGVVVDVCHRDRAKYPGEPCGRGSSYGKYVLVDHENGYATFYAHLQSIEVTLGDRLAQGETLGVMGKSGGWKAIHLHFSVYYNPTYQYGHRELTQWNFEAAVDPYGWQGKDQTDPWPWYSQVLWEIPLVCESYAGAWGGVCKLDDVSITIPSGALVDGSVVSTGIAPAPARPLSAWQLIQNVFVDIYRLLTGGNAPAQGDAATAWPLTAVQVSQPYTITIAFDPNQMQHLDPAQAQIFFWNEETSGWEGLDTTVDLVSGLASAQASQTGNFALQAPLLCANDPQEPNDLPESATQLAAGVYGFDVPSDQDWYVLPVEAGWQYEISVLNLADGVYPALALRAGDELTVLATGRDTMPIQWSAAEVGQVFLQVTPRDGSATGCQASYQLAVSSAPSNASGYRLFLPLTNLP